MLDPLYSSPENGKNQGEPNFKEIFYELPTFHLSLDRYIFYTKGDKKKEKIIKETDESIDKLSNKHDNDIKNIMKKIDAIIDIMLLSQKHQR